MRITLVCGMTVCVILLFCGAIWLVRQGWGSVIGLPNGYQLIILSSNTVALTDRTTHGGVEPNVDGYAVIDPIVVGHVAPASGYASVPGYFIVNTSNGKMRLGLSRSEWEASLRGNGINYAVNLHRPSGLDSP